MRVIAFDTETWLIQPGLLAPRLVCVSMAEQGATTLFLARDGIELLRRYLSDPGVVLLGHNVAYDFAVVAAYDPSLLPLIFEAYAQGRVRDTQVRQELIDIASGRREENGATWAYRKGEWVKADVSLAGLAALYLGKDRWHEKHADDAWRLRYHELDGVALAEWPEAAVKYAKEDAADTRDVFEAQGGIGTIIPTEDDQVRAAWALHLMSAWGIRTDPEAVAVLERELLVQQEAQRRRLIRAGILVERKATKAERDEGKVDFTRSETKRGKSVEVAYRWAQDKKKVEGYVKRVYERRGLDAPQTKTGRVATDKDTLYESGSRLLALVADGGGVSKILGTYIPALKHGTSAPINARFRVLVSSGRTSCQKPNLQNLPTGRRVGGVRECFVPRAGYLLASVDYDTLELCALAQVCLDRFAESRMAASINADRDLHSEMASSMTGLSYEDVEAGKGEKGSAAKKGRDSAKVANFGFPGGLGAKSLVDFARATYKVSLDLGQAMALKNAWLAQWPEMNLYFSWVNSLVGFDRATIQHPITGFVRGNVGYTDGCNHFFQHLAAAGAKRALFAVARECYEDRGTALFGTRPVVFVHDEIVAEVPEWRAHEAAARLAEVMVEQMRTVIKDVKVSASPCLMRRWYKDAKAVYENNRLVPWEP